MASYIAAVAAMLRQAEVRLGTAVVGIVRASEGYVLRLDDGTARPVDGLILATNAAQAAALLAGLPAAAELRNVLSRIEYGTTRIAIHGDRRLMPTRRRDWSVVNTRFDGVHSQNTMYKAWQQPAGGQIFKSWITYDEAPPAHLHRLVTFGHAKITRGYVEAQRALTALQGRRGIWVAGVYTNGIDSHESAIRSAVAIAERLAPGAARLGVLGQETPPNRDT